MTVVGAVWVESLVAVEDIEPGDQIQLAGYLGWRDVTEWLDGTWTVSYFDNVESSWSRGHRVEETNAAQPFVKSLKALRTGELWPVKKAI